MAAAIWKPEMSTKPKLVIGANGYLGSHVTRQLVAEGHDVRTMVREGANTIGIDDLKTTRFVGDIWNDDVQREAMTGCDVVYYCVVDTRGWLRPAPLFTPMSTARETCRDWQKTLACNALSSPAAT
jgi:dihydroflavonol-4-reductase